MKNSHTLKRWGIWSAATCCVALTLVSCGASQTASRNDGIYNTNSRNQEIVAAQTEANNGYKQYFSSLKEEPATEEVITNVDNYTSNNEDTAERRYGNWGSETSNVEINVYASPYYGYGYWNSYWGFPRWNYSPWGFGYGYGFGGSPWMWGGHYGLGWGGGYYGPYWGGGYYGLGWGYGHYGPGWGGYYHNRPYTNRPSNYYGQQNAYNGRPAGRVGTRESVSRNNTPSRTRAVANTANANTTGRNTVRDNQQITDPNFNRTRPNFSNREVTPPNPNSTRNNTNSNSNRSTTRNSSTNSNATRNNNSQPNRSFNTTRSNSNSNRSYTPSSSPSRSTPSGGGMRSSGGGGGRR